MPVSPPGMSFQKKVNSNEKVRRPGMTVTTATVDGCDLVNFHTPGTAVPPESPGSPGPETGDPAQFGRWMLLTALTAIILAAMIYSRNRRN